MRHSALLSLTCVSIVAACAGTQSTPIADLLERATAFDGRDVTVQGDVASVLKIPFVDRKMYTVRQGSSEIMIVTTAALPTIGQHVRVHGRFSTVATVDSKGVGPHITLDDPAK